MKFRLRITDRTGFVLLFTWEEGFQGNISSETFRTHNLVAAHSVRSIVWFSGHRWRIGSQLSAMALVGSLAAAGAGSAAEGGVACGICHNEELLDVGELDVCFHRWDRKAPICPIPSCSNAGVFSAVLNKAVGGRRTSSAWQFDTAAAGPGLMAILLCCSEFV